MLELIDYIEGDLGISLEALSVKTSRSAIRFAPLSHLYSLPSFIMTYLYRKNGWVVAKSSVTQTWPSVHYILHFIKFFQLPSSSMLPTTAMYSPCSTSNWIESFRWYFTLPRRTLVGEDALKYSCTDVFAGVSKRFDVVVMTVVFASVSSVSSNGCWSAERFPCG